MAILLQARIKESKGHAEVHSEHGSADVSQQAESARALTPLPFLRRRFFSAAGTGATACHSAADLLLLAGLAGGGALMAALPLAAAA